MNKLRIAGAVLVVLITVAGANAQQSKEVKKGRKEAVVVHAKKIEVVDKTDLKRLRAIKNDDKLYGSKKNVKEDRKAIRKADVRVVKDEAKKDVAKVKKVF